MILVVGIWVVVGFGLEVVGILVRGLDLLLMLRRIVVKVEFGFVGVLLYFFVCFFIVFDVVDNLVGLYWWLLGFFCK